MRPAARLGSGFGLGLREKLGVVVGRRGGLLLGLELELLVVVRGGGIVIVVIVGLLRVEAAGGALGRLLQGQGRTRTAASDPLRACLTLLD